MQLPGLVAADGPMQVDTLISTPSILSKYRRGDYLNIKTVVTGGEPCPQA